MSDDSADLVFRPTTFGRSMYAFAALLFGGGGLVVGLATHVFTEAPPGSSWGEQTARPFFYAGGLVVALVFIYVGLVLASSVVSRMTLSTEGLSFWPVTAGFRLRWDEVDCWEETLDTDDRPVVRFHLRDAVFPREVGLMHVGASGLAPFLAQVRKFVPEKELPAPKG